MIDTARASNPTEHRAVAYAEFMDRTNIAVEVSVDGRPIGWVTGHDSRLWVITDSTGKVGEIPPDEFEQFLDGPDLYVIERCEVPAFREAFGE